MKKTNQLSISIADLVSPQCFDHAYLDGECKNVTEIVTRKWEEIDFAELVRVTYLARTEDGLETPEVDLLETHMKGIQDRFPLEVAFLALEEKKLIGWLGIERATSTMGELRRWHPFVVPSERQNEIGNMLIAQCMNYAEKNGITRIEVGFDNVQKSSQQAFEIRKKLLERYGWKKLEEALYMACNPSELNLPDIKNPTGFELSPLTGSNHEDLFDSYLSAFLTGDAREIFDMNDNQRRDYFDKLFSRDRPLLEDASLVVTKESKIAGFILTRPRQEEAHVEVLGIHPSYRRRGLAKSMLTTAMHSESECR
ncbi:MAG: GNAT family N-acetyltransferase [Candidatus Thorarchaeota archaeon]|jgi:ribosomal protein S18 acetylase RimI-like enzyme